MRAQMQERPLALTHIFHRAEQLFAGRRIVVGTRDDDQVTTIAEWAGRVRRLAAALDARGLSADARVATFASNHRAHLEAYFAVPLTGRVLHTVNVRLSAAHLKYIVGHAQDEALLVDRALLAAIWPLADELPSVRVWIVIEDGGGAPLPDDPRLLDYDALLEATPPFAGRFDIADENLACGLCYTSGTTGAPRGVVYSHRSTVLHTLMLMTAGSVGISEADTVMPIVPMFHADAWGLPYAAIFSGATLVLPGARTAPADLLALAARQGVTVAAAATTVWNMLAPLLEDASAPELRLRMALTGASAASQSLSERIRAAIGVPINHSWGMTEISPMAVLGGLRPEDDGASDEEKAEIRGRQGRPVPLVELRVAGPDGALPWDGTSVGEIEIAGPFVAAGYFGGDGEGAFTDDGWLRTGDLGSIDPDGYLRIKDRLKDVIKSGGEWISSVELENAIMAHPDVAEAAVVGRPHEKWAERPVAAVVVRQGRTVTAAGIIEHLRPLVARWWLPDEIVFLEALPKTATGKFSKVELRALLAVRPGHDRT